MKVIILNGSPKKEEGNTGLILKPFIEGIKSTGVKLDVYNTYDLNINNCQGCVKCLVADDGICVQSDDMDWLLPKLCQADIKIFASPIYAHSYSASIKNIIDRLYPVFWPHLKVINNKCVHPVKPFFKKGIMLFVGTCGNWGMENFNNILELNENISKSISHENAGSILRPHASMLKYMLYSGEDVSDILDSLHKAGVELIKNKKISNKTKNIISRDLLSEDEYIKKVNSYYDEVIKLQKNED